MRKLIAAFLFLVASRASAYTLAGSTYTTDGTASDVQAAINAVAAHGVAEVDIPVGAYTYTSGLTISGKTIHLKGVGAGKIIARSTSAVTVASSGTVTWTLHTSGLAISPGDLLTAYRVGGQPNGGFPSAACWIKFTVTSYSGTTLTGTATSSTGSGSQNVWSFMTEPTLLTSITANAGSTVLLNLTEDTTGSIEVEGIRFVNGTGTGDLVQMHVATSGQLIKLHDCTFISNNSQSDCIESDGNRGLVWNCSFEAHPFSAAQLAIHHGINSSNGSWTSASTMGAADTTGKQNLYLEDSYVTGFLLATDFDNNSRSVVRHNYFDNAGVGTHGRDSSSYGVRHYELYDNIIHLTGASNGTALPFSRVFFLRGGTGVICDNTLDSETGSDYGGKPVVEVTVLNLQRNTGPNPNWGGGVSNGLYYPCPAQVGFGYVTGTGTDGLGRTNDSITYVGDSEPLYIWNNSGVNAITVSKSDGPDGSYSGPAPADTSANYIVSGRDYFLNNAGGGAGAKPGYSKYTYPHPLRTDLGGDTTPPTITSIVIGSGGTTATVTFSEVVSNGAGGSGGWTFSPSSGAATMTYGSGSGTATWTMNLSRTIYVGETGNAGYTQPGNGVEDAAGNDLATVSSLTISITGAPLPSSLPTARIRRGASAN